jgi:DNA invertase Pin-like site-specific DNA recombinase
MRIGIYARVSTLDKGQDPENQLRELRAWCVAAGYSIAGEYVEHESVARLPISARPSPP